MGEGDGEGEYINAHMISTKLFNLSNWLRNG